MFRKHKQFIVAIVMVALAALPAFYWMNAGAATYSDFVIGDFKLARSALEPTNNWMPFVQYRKFDFSDPNINSGSGVTNGDVVRLFNVTRNTIVEEFGLRVTTAAQSGTSATVGDGGDADGFVKNTITSNGVPFIDLDEISEKCSFWGISQPSQNAQPNTGASSFVVAGVSITPTFNTGNTLFQTVSVRSNIGDYFKGASPYMVDDTIDMTIYCDLGELTATAGGVTPIFEAYIKGFKRVVP